MARRRKARSASLPWPFGWIRKLLRGGLLGLVFAAVIGGLWYYSEQEHRERMSWEGPPAVQRSLDWRTFHRILRNEGFLVGWSDLRMTPLWVLYRLDANHPAYRLPRPDGFERDWRSGLPLSSDAYTGSGYDRGHMAPNYAIASVYGREAQRQTFLMTNIAPQRPDLNRRLWQRLEAAVMDDMLPRFGTLWVVSGPIYGESFEWLPSCQRSLARLIELELPTCVSIPEAFYKIIVAPGEPGQGPRALAFIMPQRVRGDEPLDRYLVSIDEIEARTGLDFFPGLPASSQSQLESQVDTSGWQLERYARRPSRY
ncbi:DNA/RNA non-specific endonuclease [Halotalea alkalilenta]|uniref:Endonuclease n=1 Tax=Halotalea alkalilenta TaxID=376489 RepID=A0A172YH35_9GAMM|nr:DNA/RNA non-specific endonuclease [Halotalea alkalilenta]ANF58581.1 endonuclease [Halotalea alkalilenta]